MTKKNQKESNQSLTFAIYYLSDCGDKPSEIAKKLDTTVKVVNDTINSRPVEHNKTIKTTSSKITSKDMMIRETAGKGTKSVAIMTKAASEVNDSFKKKLNNDIVSRTSRNAIYRPNSKK